MTRGRARTVFIGSGGFGRPAIEALDDHDDVELVGVVTAPDRPAGRHGRRTSTPIHDAARELGIADIQIPERLRTHEATAAVLKLRPDLIVLADYGQLVPPALLDVRHGALNLHPSLLPRHRGATPIPAAILAGDDETGVTLMRMDRGLDTGPIVVQERTPLRGDEVAPDLESTLAAMAAQILDAALGPWLRGEIEAPPAVRGGCDADEATPTRGWAPGRVAIRRRARTSGARLPALARFIRRYRCGSTHRVDGGAGGTRSAGWNLRYRRDRSGRWRSATAVRRPAGGRQADVVGGVRPRSTGDRRQ